MRKRRVRFELEQPFAKPGLTKQTHRGRILIILSIFLAGGIFVWFQKSEKTITEVAAPSNIAIQEKLPEQPKENSVSHTVAEGDIPAAVFAEYGKMSANETQSLLADSQAVYDFTRIKIGQNLQFIFDGQGKTERIQYYPNTEDVIIVEREGTGFKARKESIPYEVEEETLSIAIDEFLFKDALDAGLSEASILEIADVFSFDIDFATEIREGDEMKVVYEKRFLDGHSAPDGKILAAKFINTGQEYFAYYFNADGEGSHYDADGHELLRQFLRAPLTYRAITSGYTGARFHPITKTISAHYQIDYAAPMGTPVSATARGTVTNAGWETGWGNIVRITHDNGYTTHYGHLSAYGKGIKAGVSVSQGQVVGYVGSTGWSTGPHLDYGMKLNGSPINPLSLKLPKGTPLAGEQMEKFQEIKRKYEPLLN